MKKNILMFSIFLLTASTAYAGDGEALWFGKERATPSWLSFKAVTADDAVLAADSASHAIYKLASSEYYVVAEKETGKLLLSSTAVKDIGICPSSEKTIFFCKDTRIVSESPCANAEASVMSERACAAFVEAPKSDGEASEEKAVEVAESAGNESSVFSAKSETEENETAKNVGLKRSEETIVPSAKEFFVPGDYLTQSRGVGLDFIAKTAPQPYFIAERGNRISRDAVFGGQIVSLPDACDSAALFSERGLVLALCAEQGGYAAYALENVEKSLWRKETVIFGPVGKVSSSTDGTLVLASSSGEPRLWVRSPREVGEEGAWREEKITDNIAYFPHYKGRLVVISGKKEEASVHFYTEQRAFEAVKRFDASRYERFEVSADGCLLATRGGETRLLDENGKMVDATCKENAKAVKDSNANFEKEVYADAFREKRMGIRLDGGFLGNNKLQSWNATAEFILPIMHGKYELGFSYRLSGGYKSYGHAGLLGIRWRYDGESKWGVSAGAELGFGATTGKLKPDFDENGKDKNAEYGGRQYTVRLGGSLTASYLFHKNYGIVARMRVLGNSLAWTFDINGGVEARF